MEQVNPVLVVIGIALVAVIIYFGTRNRSGNAPQLQPPPKPKVPADQIGDEKQGSGTAQK